MRRGIAVLALVAAGGSASLFGQNRPRAEAWVAVDATGTPIPSFKHNSSGGDITVQHNGPGQYTVTYLSQGTPVANGSGGMTQVTSMSSQTRCKSETYVTSGDNIVHSVHCRDLTGADKDSAFADLYYRESRQTAAWVDAYAWNDQNTPAAPFPANPGWSWNSIGGANTISRTGTGAYRVTFGGLAAPRNALGNGGTVLVTASGFDNAYCNPEVWNALNADITVDVGCFSPAGNPMDTHFVVSFVTDVAFGVNVASDQNLGAFAWADQQSAATYIPNVPYSLNTAGKPITVTRNGPGAYVVNFGGQQATYSIPVVSAYQTNITCAVGVPSPAPNSSVNVLVTCADPSGTTTDIKFDILFLSSSPAPGPAKCNQFAIQAASDAVAVGDYAPGAKLTTAALNEVKLANDDNYGTDANGVIFDAPTAGTGAYNFFLNASPTGVAPAIGGQKLALFGNLFGQLAYGSLSYGWGINVDTSGATVFNWNPLGSSNTITAPAAPPNNTRLFLRVADDNRADNSGSFAVEISDGVCAAVVPTLATLKASPASLTFNIAPSQADFSANVQITDNGGIGIGPIVSELSSVPWLSFTPRSQTTPATMTATISTKQLQAGVTNKTSIILHSTATPYPLTIPVTVNFVAAITVNCTPTTGPTQVGVSYTTTCTASGGTSPYNWTNDATVGPLPNGLSLSAATGASITVSGKPTAAGAYKFAIKVTDSATPVSQSASQTFSGTITSSPSTLSANPPSLTFNWTVGSAAPASQTVAVSASPTNVGFTIDQPVSTWLSALANNNSTTPSTLTVSIAPTSQLGIGALKDNIVVRSNGASAPLTIPITLNVSGNASALTISCPVPASFTANTPFTITCTGGGGTLPYKWSSLDMPSYLTLTSSGATATITGTASVGHKLSFTVNLQDSSAAPQTVSQQVSTFVNNTNFRVLNAAGYAEGSVAPNSIVAIFGIFNNIVTTVNNTTPVPTTLGNAMVTVIDSKGISRDAPLFYVSNSQINAAIPDGTSPGLATIIVKVVAGGITTTTTSGANINPVSGGIFTTSSAANIPAAFYLRVTASGAQTQFFTFDTTSLGAVTIPRVAGEQIYLILYGTGFRNHVSAATATVGGVSVPVLGALAQSQFLSEDQINIGPLPGSLPSGTQTVQIVFDGIPANSLTIKLQ